MQIKINGELEKKDVEYLIQRIAEYAESCAKDYQEKKATGQPQAFEQGLAQAYTEILDVIKNWGIETRIKIVPDLEKYATEHLA